MTRILGLDVGDRRIGVAIAGPDGRAAPLTTLRRAADPARDTAALDRLIAAQDVDEIIVGLPLDMSGGEGGQAVRTREWVDAVLRARIELVRYRDERLSSHRAEERVGPMKRGRSGGPPTRAQREDWRSRVDREAAAIILQDELDARAASRGPHTENTE